MIRLKCQECGYIHNCISENDTFKECPICDGKMKLNNVDEIVAGECLEKMKDKIRNIGKCELWDLIERNFPNPRTRLRFRQLYYMALEELRKSGEIK